MGKVVGLSASAQVESGFGLGRTKPEPTNLVGMGIHSAAGDAVAKMRANPAKLRLAPHLRKHADWVAFSNLAAQLVQHTLVQGIAFGQKNPHATEPPPELVFQAVKNFGELLYEAVALGEKLGDTYTDPDPTK